MPSILGFLRVRPLIRDSSDTLFAAGVEAWKKYEETRELQYLTEAVRTHQAALDLRVSGHPLRSKSLFCTAMALWAHCQGAVTKGSSSTVIAYYDEALRLLLDNPYEPGHQATVCANLGMVYFTLFRLGKEDRKAFPATDFNISKAIENYRSALQLRPAKNDPDRPSSLINLSIALIQKDSKDGLMNAIINLREAAELCTTKPTRRPLLLLSLNHLAQAYDSHYHYSEDIRDVVGRADALQRVLDLTDEGKGRLVPLVNLANARWRLWEIEHNRGNDLDEAVLRGREALELSDGSDKIIHAKALITLAHILSTRYDQTYPKNVTDLDEAIQYYREAIDSDPEDGPNSVLCSSLASAIYIRCQDFEGKVEGATLEDAISYSQKALHARPKDGPLHLKIQNNLGSIYMTQFDQPTTNDLDEEVLHGREALKLSDGSDEIIHAKALITLAHILSNRYDQSYPKNVTDLDEAIQYYREAINPDLQDGPNPVLCSSLASAIYIRCQDFEEEVEGATLEDAISYNQEALHACPKDDPLYLKIQNNLGSIYMTQFDKSGAEGDLVKAIQAYEDLVCHCPFDDDDYTYYRRSLKQANRALLRRRKRDSETAKGSVSTKPKLCRRRSVAISLGSERSSDESCPSRPASITETR